MSHSVFTSPFPFFWTQLISCCLLSIHSLLLVSSLSFVLLPPFINYHGVYNSNRSSLHYGSFHLARISHSSQAFIFAGDAASYGGGNSHSHSSFLCNIQILRTNLHSLFLPNVIKADSETVRRQESSEMNALGKTRFGFIKKRTVLILSVKVYLNPK